MTTEKKLSEEIRQAFHWYSDDCEHSWIWKGVKSLEQEVDEWKEYFNVVTTDKLRLESRLSQASEYIKQLHELSISNPLFDKQYRVKFHNLIHGLEKVLNEGA